MANIKELKKKIKSTKGTHKITTAMKLVSAAKLAKAQHAIQSARPYAEEILDTIKTVSALVEDYEHNFFKPNENPHKALLVISSNKGLCGGYNAQLAKKVRAYLKDHGEKTKVFFIGKKVKELVINEVNLGKFYEFEKTEPTFDEIRKVGTELSELFTSGEFGEILVATNVFRSAISFEPTVSRLLPLSLTDDERESLKKDLPFDFKYDPDPTSILEEVIPQVYSTTLYTAYLDAVASEHGSRMAAMDAATKNCNDMIRTLTLKMNKIRQASITTELIEVISGAESLNG